MRAKTRRKLEMARRVLEFCRQHRDPSPAFVAATARLEERVARAHELAEQQLDGRSEVRTATDAKADLKRKMMDEQLDHLTSVARIAAAEDPEVLQKLTFPADATTYLAFRAAASGMAAEAESRKELLIKHGLSEEILNALKKSLEEFDAAVERGAAGRLARVRATAELVTVAEEAVQIVRVMNGMVRHRFANQSEVLAAWESARNVVAAPKPEEKPDAGATPPTGGTPPSSGDVSPAA
jgi:hypothetical protein